MRAPHVRLKELREKKGYATQKAFCAHARRYGYKLDTRRYGGIETGRIVPRLDEVVTICKAMEISADAWLFDYQDPRELRDIKLLDDPEVAIVRELIRGLLSLR